MNLEVEMAQDSWLFEFGIELSKSLDAKFGIQRDYFVMSQRDVPGIGLPSFFVPIGFHRYFTDQIVISGNKRTSLSSKLRRNKW